MICFKASFNVGDVEVWTTSLYLDRNSVFSEIENSIDTISDCLLDYTETIEGNEVYYYVAHALVKLKQYGCYKEDDFDFLILECPIYKDYEEKRSIINGNE